MIEEFLLHLQFEKKLSPHSITAYRHDLDQFQSYLHGFYSVDEVEASTSEMIRSWVIDLLDQKMNPKSVNRKLSALKTYFKYLVKKGVVENNPLQKVISPKTSKRLPSFIEKEDMASLFSNYTIGNDFNQIRDNLLLELLYGTGMRLSELIQLKISDYNQYQSTVKVLGKRKKERIIPLSTHLNQKMTNYIDVLKSIFSDCEPNTPIFVTDKMKKMYPKMVYRIVHSYLEMVSTIDKKSPHVLRHTFATHMLDNGADINAIKEILGHANLAATQVYTHNTMSKLKNIYKLAHPRA